MIELRDLEFQYRDGGFRLNVPELSVESGETVAIVGPSGCGKTTVLALVAGLLVPNRGEVRVGGERIDGMSDTDRRSFRICRLGLVFQEFELLDHLDVVDNVLLPCRISPALRVTPDLRERAGALAGELGLGDKLRRNVRHLSQGERQRAALGRALLLEPSVLLCDEPTGNLDPETSGTVLDLLFEQVEKRGTTLLTVTHDHDVLERFDRVIDMKTFRAAGAA